jgi:F-type H+-transporting ATPase subunit b
MKLTNTGLAKNPVRRWLLAALLVGVMGGVGRLRAQSQAPPEQRQASTAGTPGHAEGPGRQLARQTREAAGEEKDETAEFKQSASVRLIARVTGMSLLHSYWLCVLLNFIVIAAVIIWSGRKYLPALFRDRTAAIQKAMQEAQRASEEARRRLAEIESRLMRLDGEIGMMRNAAEREAAEEEARIQAAAREDANKIVRSAEQEIAAAAKTARRELMAYAADLAVSLAQKHIRVDAASDRALVRDFSGQLGGLSGGPGDGSGRDPGKDRH